jgi:hypothetical protein
MATRPDVVIVDPVARSTAATFIRRLRAVAPDVRILV